MKHKPLEALLWSIALPGLGQLLNRKYLKGILLIIMEFMINIGSHLNLSIIYSFKGDIQTAIDYTNYQWLMFYPCIYMFGIWDSYKDAGGGDAPFATLPFIGAAYLGTVGLMFSDVLTIRGVLLGPVWLAMLFAFMGIGLGFLLKWTLGSVVKE